jgi:hypothetical protein
MKTSYWFGGSIVQGTELEKCGTVEQDRFSLLVSQHCGWIEQNFATQGSSISHIADQIIKTKFEPESIIFIIIPLYCRYFWIDENYKQCNIMPNDKTFRQWYKTVDNWGYRTHTVFQQLFLIKLFLEKNNLKFYFFNEMDRAVRFTGDTVIYFDEVYDHFLLPPESYLLEELEWNFDQGYPDINLKHKYFFPCEHHPNVHGHRRLADKIISLIDNKISISKE